MRVFFALTFYDEDKDKLTYFRDLIANNSIKGRFTTKENFHITLEFIGEVLLNQVDELCDILKPLTMEQPHIRIEHFGAFKRRDREIVWLGMEKLPSLKQLHNDLLRQLEDYGYEVEKRKYTPHITLGRQVLLEQNISDWVITPFEIPIKSIALMESKRIGDQLIYEVIDEVELSPLP